MRVSTTRSTGVYEGRSTAFSGPAYAQMRAQVTVLEPTEYEAWLEQQASDIQDAQEAIADRVAAGDTLAVQLEGEPAAGDAAAAEDAGAAAESAAGSDSAAPTEGAPQG